MQKEQLSNYSKDNDVSESKNTILFSVIRSKLPSAEKLKKFTQYLKEGADVNSLDANDKNNTLLHVAIVYEEVEIVKLLLNKNVDATITNDDNDTVLDIVQLLDTPKQLELAGILYKKYGYQKRPGTSGVRGELYETKLLSLILFRALYDENIKEFILGTNLDDIGALDDIILRYDTKNPQKTKMLFLQAKHRENEIMTVDDLLNPKKEINVYKYFESYIRVRQKFVTDNGNTMFQGAIKNIDCKFIIYTSAKQYNGKNQNTVRNITLEEIQDGNKFIKASETGKVLQLKYANEFVDLAEFVSFASKTRVLALAQTLVKFLVKENSKYKNMMLDNIIKEYHIYLAQNIVETINSTSNNVTSNSSKACDYIIGQFRSSFLTTDNEYLQLIKFEIRKELGEINGLSPNPDQIELNNILKSFTFKLPTDFGCHTFSFGGNKIKQQNKLTHLCSIFEQILQSTCAADSTCKYIYVHLDDDSVGPEGIIQSKDLGNYWFGGLVGNLLIYDKETEMLKFNFNEQYLSADNIKILQELKNKRDVTQMAMFRFNINYLNFPKLSLNSQPCRNYDQKLVQHFVDNLRIYTNQAKEDEVERVLKDEIYTLYNNRKNHHDLLFRIKCDAIFLTFHDNIQKWWKQPISAPYLTKRCKFYQEVVQEILDSPVLSVVHFISYKKVNNSLVEFEEKARKSMKLSEFLNSKETITVIVSDEIRFSSIKVIQCLNEIETQPNYTFINLDNDFVKSCYDLILNELDNLIQVTNTLLVVSQGNTEVDFKRLHSITEKIKGKIIIITKNSLEDNSKLNCPERFIYKDNTNNYANLSRRVREIIREERKVIFQGFPVIINSVLSDSALDLISPALLWNIIHGDEIEIGNKLDVLNNYIKRSISRIIAINTEKNDLSELCFKEDISEDFVGEINKDIVVITDFEDIFEKTCQIYKNTNIHWFTKMQTDTEILWNKSHGTIKTLMKYIQRFISFDSFMSIQDCNSFNIMTLKEIENKTVIINGEPSTGKTTLLTYLAMNTKKSYPNLWILRINLLDRHFLDQLSYWNDCNINVDIVNVMILIYSAVNPKYYTNKDIYMKILKLITVNNVNEVHFSVCDNENLLEVDLSEIKLLNYFYNHDKLVVLLDGFDEICPDFTNEGEELLKILKTSKIAHLWITTAPYKGLEKLELVLDTFCFNLNPLEAVHKMEHLENVWSEKTHLKISIYRLFCYICNALGYNINLLTPSNLCIVSDICENLLAQYIGDTPTHENFPQVRKIDYEAILNSTSIYEHFAKRKFNKQFEEKNSSTNAKDPYIKKLKENAYKWFVKNHKTVAAYLLLDRDVVLCEYDFESLQDFIRDIISGSEKTDFIKCVDNNLEFIHSGCAEYFAVEFLFDILLTSKSYRSFWQYIIDNILVKNKIIFPIGIPKFIDSKLQRDRHKIFNSLRSTEHMTTVFDILLNQFRYQSTNAFFVAIEKKFKYIVIFLLECIKAPINKDKLPIFIDLLHKKCNNVCVICFALANHYKYVFEHLTELHTKIDNKKLQKVDSCNTSDLLIENEKQCVSLNALLHSDQLTLDTIEQFLTASTMGQSPPEPINTAHCILGRHGFLTILCQDYIARFSTEQRLQLFNHNDFVNPSVEYTTEKLHYSWITAESISKEEFIKKCSTLDVSILTSILLMLKRILIMIYDKTDVDMENFIFEILPNVEADSAKSLNKINMTEFKSHKSQLPQLLLLRLLFNSNIKDFTLTNSIRDLDLFDNVILRYTTDDSTKSKMIFLQIDSCKENRLIRYFKSYILIREKFITDNESILFQGPMKDLDCKFIIYTTCKNYFYEKSFLQLSDENSLIKTNDALKIYQFKYTETVINNSVLRLFHSRAADLGKTIYDLFQDGDDNDNDDNNDDSGDNDNSGDNDKKYFIDDSIMEEDILKTYHVFIAEKIIKIDSLPNKSRNYKIGRFRSSFLSSYDESLVIIRNVIYKKIAIKNNIQLKHLINQNNKIKAIRFPLPTNFGEYSFSFYGSETEQQEKLDRLLYIFQKICNNHQQVDSKRHWHSKFTVIEFDGYSMTPDDKFKITDLLENDSLAGLVGNLLIFDKETEILKINLNEENLNQDSIKVLKGLKQNFDVDQLSKFRFDINIPGFPKLSLKNTNHDRKLAQDFFNNLQCYANQANNDDVEDLLKQELNKYFNVQKRQDDFQFRVKCDSIFFSYINMSTNDDYSWKRTYSTECYKQKKIVKNKIRKTNFFVLDHPLSKWLLQPGV